jgi:hypothetical protein
MTPRVATAFGLAIAVTSCHRSAAPPPPLPAMPARVLAEPPPQITTDTALTTFTAPTSPEPRITYAATNWDVRDVLRFIAEKGGYSLVLSPDVNKHVTVDFTDVPVSEAFRSVLEQAGLTLQATSEKLRVPFNPSVVFYQLPVNVDSLPVDAIMKRFRVSRDLAELMVRARQKP